MWRCGRLVNVLSADGSRGMRRGVELLVGYDGGGAPALRGDVYGCSSSDQPRCDDFDWRTDVGGRDGGDEFSKFTTANGGVTATNFGAGDKVVVSTVPGQSQCECAGVYTIASIDASNHWVELTEAVPACTPARCQMDKSAATMAGLTNGVSYRFTVTATNEFGTSEHSVWSGNCVDSMAPPLTASFRRETEGLCTNSQTAIAAQALSGITNNVVTVASGGSVEDYAVGDTVVISSMDSGTCAVAGTYYYVKVSASARTIEVTATLSSSAHANCQIERSAFEPGVVRGRKIRKAE